MERFSAVKECLTALYLWWWVYNFNTPKFHILASLPILLDPRLIQKYADETGHYWMNCFAMPHPQLYKLDD